MSVADAGRRQGGFTMIEALVTFVILAIGLLGIVTLMMTSKTSQFEAVQRARAVSLADTIVERIRENPDALTGYLRALDNPLGQGQITSAPGSDCETSACDPNEVRDHDLWAWEQQLDGMRATAVESGVATGVEGLKEVRACILFDPYGTRARTGQLTVLLQWIGLHETSDGVAGGDVCGPDVADEIKPFRRQLVVSTFVLDESEL